MTREARCSCGQLAARVVGDPKIVMACNCLNCQRRTGSVFGVSAYFENAQLEEIVGKSKAFKPTTASGLSSDRHFCPDCGAAVYWKGDAFPNHTGIPVGAFADPNFPAPVVSVWARSKHGWVEFPKHCISHDAQDLDPDLLRTLLNSSS